MYYPTLFRLGIDKVALDAIPPERLGVQGEYDHNGLARRIQHRCAEIFGEEAIAQLKIRQRGSVVVLYGCVQSRKILERVARLAMQAEGATNVELRGVEVCEPS